MTGPDATADTARIDAAFDRVLAAEAAAKDGVAACRRAAADLIAAAQARARSIAEHTDQRMRLAHARADAGVARAVPVWSAPPPPAAAVPAGLDEAVETLIDELLGLPATRP
jgi:hypothetical protein